MERDYLGQIVSDSRENLRLLGEAIALEQRHMDVAESLWRAAQDEASPSADSVAAWLGRRDGSWWYSDPRLRDGTVTALVQTGHFALIRDPDVRSAILGYVSQLNADLEEFRRGVQLQADANTLLNVRGEIGLNKRTTAASSREVGQYLAIVGDPEGRAALSRLRDAYESRIWYLGQIREATKALLASVS